MACLTIILLAGVLSDAPTQEASSEFIKNARVALSDMTTAFDAMEHMVMFGFDQLPSDIARQCLLYCLTFSEDQGIPVKVLFQYWLIDGLLEEVGFNEANHTGKIILDVLVKRGMIYLDDNDHVRMHDIIRGTLSTFSYYNYSVYYTDVCDRDFDPTIKSEYLPHIKRISLMYTEVESLHGRTPCLLLSSLILRENYRLQAISEEFFRYMRNLWILDLSYTRIKLLPLSISCLTALRMLLLVGCDHLEEIQHIGSSVQLEVLDASCCCSLKRIEAGSFDHMVFLKILDLSETSISFLTPIPESKELRSLNLQGYPFLGSEPLYGVSKGGALHNLQLGNVEDLADCMSMLWLPSGLTFQLSNRFGMKVSFDANRDSTTFVYASDDAYFFNCLKKDSPLWFNCFQKFQIVISPLMDNQITDTDVLVRKTGSIFQNSFFRTKHFAHSIEPVRYLEINGTVGVPSDLDGVLCHAELISLKRLAMTTQFSDLNITSMELVTELWVENCDNLESLLSVNDVLAISAMGNLQNLWISNMENLSSFCIGVENVTSFSCLKHLLIDCCPNLTYLFPSALCLPDLETLNIKL